MLPIICPTCNFENPNSNKFCQKCGTSLTHKVCHECSSSVPFNAENCLNCGARVGKIWLAVISKSPNLSTASPNSVEVQANKAEESEIVVTANQVNENQENSPDDLLVNSASKAEVNIAQTQALSDPSINVEVEKPLLTPEITAESELQNNVTSSDVTQEPISSFNSEEVYLDQAKRYKLLQPLPSFSEITTDVSQQIWAKVLDTQPFQESPLKALISEEKLRELAGTNNQSNLKDIEFWNQMKIPAIAQPYLGLQEQLSPALPKIHDAWEENGLSVVLLEDRSDWVLLRELWKNEQIPILQILYWLGEILKLWTALEPWHCRQSLLELSNLRLDEDEKISLQVIYQDPKDTNLNLPDLGQIWQTLFQESQRTQFNSLEQLIRDLRSGEITTITQLRSRLQDVADQLQVSQEPISDEESTRPDLIYTSQTNEDISEGDDLPTVILPMQLLSLDDAGATDIGRLRNHNEDCFGIYTQIKKQENPLGKTVQAKGLYILCDGMGGHAGGEVASVMAVDTIKRYFQANWDDNLPSEASIREAVRLTNQAIYDVNQQNARSGSGRMGTTLVLVLIHDTRAAIAHVGDSRLYRLTRKRGLEQVTVDHEVGQREIQRGVEPTLAYSRPDAYQLTQAIGPRDEYFVNPDVQFIELNEDTLLLLSSDGLSDHDLLETYWQTHLLPLLSSRANLEQGVQQLIDLANQHNGHDNITALLIRAKVRPNLEQHRII